MENNIIDKLINLSKIFKEGFTITLDNGKINQYNNTDKPFIFSYLTVIEIKEGKPLFKNIRHIPSKCIIGGWFDKEDNTYYIELNKAYKNKQYTKVKARKYNQKCIYNINTGECVKC